MKRQVVSHQNLPQKIPIGSTALLFLLMDYYEASDMVQGVVWTLWGIILIGCMANWWTQDEREIFEDESE